MSLKLGSTDTTLSAGSSVVKQMLLGTSPKFAAPVLDHVPGAAAAYSLRRLSNAYTGPVVKVRRSSDSTTADFTAAEVVDGTLTAWVGAGDGFVDTWYDQSGEGNDASQTTAGYQPQIVDSGSLVTEGGNAAVRFDGANDYLLTANIGAFQASAGIGLFAVFSKDTASTSDTFTTTNPEYIASVLNSLGSTVDAKVLWRILGGRVDYVRRNAANSAYITTRAESHTIAASQYSQSVVGGLAADLYLGGAELALSDDQSGESLSSSTSYIYIGSQDGSFRFLDGTISELIIYPSDVSASRELAEGEIAWHYGLQSQLPYDHAYAPQALGGSSQTVPTDADAIDYLERLAEADGAAVERGVAVAVDDFVKGCKADGTWDAIQASCIMCGARTLSGALVPLKTPYGSELVDIDALPTPTITDSGGSTGVWTPSTRTLSSSTTGTSDTFPRFAFPVGMTIGKRYKVSLTLNLSVSGCLKYVRVGSATLISGVSAVDSFVVDGIYTCTGTTDFQIDLNATVPGASVTIESLSIREDSFTPTGYNWTASDYSRSLGLQGDGSTKYIDSNRASNADGQNDHHIAAFVSTPTAAGGPDYERYFGAYNTSLSPSTQTNVYQRPNGTYGAFSRNSGAAIAGTASGGGVAGISRSSSSSFSLRIAGSDFTRSAVSYPPASLDSFVFAYNLNGSMSRPTNARLAFYSIGSSLDLASLDTRVAALVAAIQGALA